MNRIALINAVQKTNWLLDLPNGSIYHTIAQKLAAGENLDPYFENKEQALFVAFYSSAQEQTLNLAGATDLSSLEVAEGSIATIKLTGVLMKDDNCGDPGTVTMANVVKQLSANPNIETLIFDIDSPGGQAAGVKLLADAIKQSEKRTVAFIEEGMAASGAYWAASACDEIIVSQIMDEVGSIGAMTKVQFMDDAAALEKHGVSIKTVYAPQSPEKNYESEQAKLGNYKPLEDKLAPLAQSFINAVTENRTIVSTKEQDPLKGRMFYAEDALKLGLIDKIMTREEMMNAEAANVDLRMQTSQLNKSIHMKQFANINSLLAVEEMQASADGAYLNEGQMETIDAALAQTETAATEAANAHATALVAAQTVATEAQAKADANAEMLTAMCAKFEVEAGDSLESTAANLNTHFEVLAKKPSAQVATLTPQTIEDDGASKKSIYDTPFYHDLGQKRFGDAMYFVKQEQNQNQV